MADFEKQSYWHSRFEHEESFEWLTSSATFLPFITPYLTAAAAAAPGRTQQRILHLGSGTSDLHTHLRAAGCADVTNVDYEPLALARGRETEARVFAGDVAMRYVLADVTRLLPSSLSSEVGEAGAAGFDLVVDKSTADAVACGGEEAVRSMVSGVAACLAPGGVWISLSYSAARFRLDELPLEVEVVGKIPTPKAKAGDPDVYFWVYLLRPRGVG